MRFELDHVRLESETVSVSPNVVVLSIWVFQPLRAIILRSKGIEWHGIAWFCVNGMRPPLSVGTWELQYLRPLPSSFSVGSSVPVNSVYAMYCQPDRLNTMGLGKFACLYEVVRSVPIDPSAFRGVPCQLHPTWGLSTLSLTGRMADEVTRPRVKLLKKFLNWRRCCTPRCQSRWRPRISPPWSRCTKSFPLRLAVDCKRIGRNMKTNSIDF